MFNSPTLPVSQSYIGGKSCRHTPPLGASAQMSLHSACCCNAQYWVFTLPIIVQCHPFVPSQPHEFWPQNQHSLFSPAGPYNSQNCSAKPVENFSGVTPKCSVSLGSEQHGQGEGCGTEQRAQGETPGCTAPPFAIIPCDPPEHI